MKLRPACPCRADSTSAQTRDAPIREVRRADPSGRRARVAVRRGDDRIAYLQWVPLVNPGDFGHELLVLFGRGADRHLTERDQRTQAFKFGVGGLGGGDLPFGVL